MQSKYFGLLDNVVSIYDQTKTTTTGGVSQRTLNGNQVLGPPLNQFMDVFTDTGLALSGAFAVSPILTGNVARIFVLGAEALGLTPLFLYNFDTVTGDKTYIGKINFQTADIALTTTTFRMIRTDDVGTTNWKIFVGTTGSVLINGGPYIINNVGLSDFTPSGTTISFATGNNQKAVYLMQDPTGVGSATVLTALAGGFADFANDKLYIHNGLAATHQYWVFDYSIAPTYVSAAVTGVAATDVIADAGHPYVNGDPVTFTAITGGAGLTALTTYFVVTAVAGVSYQLSATSGGAAINFTTDITAGTVGRAFGTSTNQFTHKTGNLPALSGILLLNNGEGLANPQHSLNSGVDCAAFGTSTTLYFGKLSELTVGAVIWPSLVSSNILGAISQVTAPTAAFLTWGEATDRFYYNSNISILYGKQLVNNIIDITMGFLNTAFYEGVALTTYGFGAVTISGMFARHGWAFFTSTTVGQRGVFAHYVQGNSFFDSAYIVSPVIDTPDSLYQFISTIEEEFVSTASMVFFYRTSGFGSISGGWVQIDVAELLVGFTPGDQVQLKVQFNPPDDAGTNPAQLSDLSMTYLSENEMSDHWQVSKDLSSSGATHRVVYYLAEVFPTVVPIEYTRAFQQGTTTSVGSANTGSNPTQYRYSTNNGTSWNALGTIPNVLGTLLEWTITPTPSVDYLPSIRES